MIEVVFMMLILPFYDAAIGIVEWCRAFKLCVAYSHIGANCGIVNRPSEKRNFDFGKWY